MYSPWQGITDTQQQATGILQALNEFETRRSANPWWSRDFWQWLDAAGASDPFTHDVQAALRRNGYWGPGTSNAVPSGMRQEMETLKNTGAPATGAAGGSFAAPPTVAPLPGLENPLVHGRLSTTLDPGMRRAAPEIYRGLRVAGACGARH